MIAVISSAAELYSTSIESRMLDYLAPLRKIANWVSRSAVAVFRTTLVDVEPMELARFKDSIDGRYCCEYFLRICS